MTDKHIIYIAIIVLLAIVSSRLIHWLVRRLYNSQAEKLRFDRTRFRFFENAIQFLVVIIATGAIIYIIPSLRSMAVTIFAGAGVLAIVIGFAAQEAFSNIISGIFIIIFKPFAVGDLLEISTLHTGFVHDITLRHTVLKDFENKLIIIPNAVIGRETITNNSIEDRRICRYVRFGISYDSDVQLAMQIMREEAEKHPLLIDWRTPENITDGDKLVDVVLLDFGDSSVNLRAACWASTPMNARRLHWELNVSIKARFDAEGIEIPFPYRTIVFKDGKAGNRITGNTEDKE